LIHVDPSKLFFFKTNSYDITLGVVLSQPGKNNLFHPINFLSCMFFLAEINYKIHDKELLAIVDAFEVCCHLLEGTQHEINVHVDHKNHQYFMMVHVLN